MTPPIHRLGADAETIGGLLSRLIDDAKQLFHAEIDYYRLLVVGRVAGLKTAVILIVAAILLLQASLTTLLIGIGLAIARLFERVGMAGGVVIAAVIGLIVSGLLVRIATGRIAASAQAAKEAAK